jgi:hypothetical protein
MLACRSLRHAPTPAVQKRERDLVVGTHNRSAIGTLMEQTRYVRLPHRNAGTSSDLHTAPARVLPGGLRWTLTWDRGTKWPNTSTPTPRSVSATSPTPGNGQKREHEGATAPVLPIRQIFAVHTPRARQGEDELNGRRGATAGMHGVETDQFSRASRTPSTPRCARRSISGHRGPAAVEISTRGAYFGSAC